MTSPTTPQPQTEAERLASEYRPTMTPEVLHSWAAEAQAMLRALAAELAQAKDELKRLEDKTEFITERRAQISHRLWAWAHEELSEPLKTRYFNIVANGTADVMEQPTYAQQYNGQKYRAEAAEAERDTLRAELEGLKAQSLAIILRQSVMLGEYSKSLMPDDPDMQELVSIYKLTDALFAAPPTGEV